MITVIYPAYFHTARYLFDTTMFNVVLAPIVGRNVPQNRADGCRVAGQTPGTVAVLDPPVTFPSGLRGASRWIGVSRWGRPPEKSATTGVLRIP